MNVSNASYVQMLFGIAAQKGALEIQANAVAKILENISVEPSQSSQAQAGQSVDIVVDSGIGTQVNIVV